MTASAPLRGAALLGGGTLVAAVFGLFFQSLLAFYFGAGADTDAWFMSLSIFGFLGKFLMLTHLKSLALPAYRGLRERRPEEARRFAVLVLRWTAGGLLALALVLLAAAPVLVDVLAPGYEGAQRNLTVSLVRIRLPALVFLGTTAASLVALESSHRFGVTVSAQKLVPAVLSLVLLLVVADRGGMIGVGWIGLTGGVAGGAIALLAVRPLLGARSKNPGTEPASATARTPEGSAGSERGPVEGEVQDAREAVVRVGRQWLSFSGSNAATFLGEWAFRVAASLLPVGLFSAVFYGRMVHDLLHGAVNDPMQTVSLPRFSDARHETSTSDLDTELGGQLRDGLATLASISVPLSVLVAVTAPWSIAILFGRGQFLADGMVAPASVALQIFVLGFLLQGMNQLVFTAAFASDRARLVNRVQIVGHLTRAAAIVPAVLLFSYAGLVGAQVAMNALVLVLLVTLAPTSWGLPRAALSTVLRGTGRGIAVATAVPLAGFLFALRYLPDPEVQGTVGRVALLFSVSLVWMGAYGAVAWLMGVPQIRSFARRVGRAGAVASALALFMGMAVRPASAQASAGPALTPADHWAVTILEALEARGTVPVGAARSGPLHGEWIDRLLSAASSGATTSERSDAAPFPARALRRLRDEMAPDDRGGTLSVGVGYTHARSGTPGASLLAGVRLGRAGDRLWASAHLGAFGGESRPLREGGVSVRIGSLALRLGRSRLQLGGGLFGGLALSAAAPLDGALLTTWRPFSLGWLGRGTATAGVFRMGAYAPPVSDPWFALARLTVAPTERVRFGASRAALVGGRFSGGTPPFQTIDHPPDTRDLGFGDVVDILVGRVTEFDNQVWAFDARGSLAGWGVPLVAYGEVALEDNERSFGDGAVQVGAILDVPVPAGLLAVRYEYTGIGPAGRWCSWCDTLPAFWYQHTRFQDGWQAGGDLLGHPLGGYGRQHVLAASGADRTLRIDGTVALRRLRRDEFNLLHGPRPGAAWGSKLDLRVRPSHRISITGLAELEWGDDGWRTGRFALGVTAFRLGWRGSGP